MLGQDGGNGKIGGKGNLSLKEGAFKFILLLLWLWGKLIGKKEGK